MPQGYKKAANLVIVALLGFDQDAAGQQRCANLAKECSEQERFVHNLEAPPCLSLDALELCPAEVGPRTREIEPEGERALAVLWRGAETARVEALEAADLVNRTRELDRDELGLEEVHAVLTPEELFTFRHVEGGHAECAALECLLGV